MPSNFEAYEFIYFTIKFLSFSIYHAVICESITLPVKMCILKTQRNASEVCQIHTPDAKLLNPFNICSDILMPNINQNSSQKRLKTKHHPVMLPKHWPAHFSITFWLK